MGIEDALGLELFCCLVYKRFTEYRETRFKSPTEKLTIRQYIVYQQPIHPPHLEEALPGGAPMSLVWILKRLVSVFIDASQTH